MRDDVLFIGTGLRTTISTHGGVIWDTTTSKNVSRGVEKGGESSDDLRFIDSESEEKTRGIAAGSRD